jgi:hypothetical protein
MRRSTVLFAAVLLVLTAGPAGASPQPPRGTLDLDFGPLQTLRFRGNPMSVSFDYSSGGSHLSTLRFHTGITGYSDITGSGTVPITDPETSGAVRSIRVANVTLGSGTLTGISGAPPLGRNEIPLKGFVRVCLIVGGCFQNLPLNLTLNDGNTGVGVGGLLTGSYRNSIRISIVNAPWTLGTVSGINQTAHGGFKTISRAGFVHGVASASNSTTAASGSVVIQLIAPQQVTTQGIPGNNDVLMLFPTLTMIVPEPGLLLLIGSGVAGLGMLGRSRMKKQAKHPGSGRR